MRYVSVRQTFQMTTHSTSVLDIRHGPEISHSEDLDPHCWRKARSCSPGANPRMCGNGHKRDEMRPACYTPDRIVSRISTIVWQDIVGINEEEVFQIAFIVKTHLAGITPQKAETDDYELKMEAAGQNPVQQINTQGETLFKCCQLQAGMLQMQTCERSRAHQTKTPKGARVVQLLVAGKRTGAYQKWITITKNMIEDVFQSEQRSILNSFSL